MPRDFQQTFLKNEESIWPPHSSLPALLFVLGSLEAGLGDERMCLACTLAGNFSGYSLGISDFVEKGFSLSNHRLP